VCFVKQECFLDPAHSSTVTLDQMTASIIRIETEQLREDEQVRAFEAPSDK
jgi:hypothetical protein